MTTDLDDWEGDLDPRLLGIGVLLRTHLECSVSVEDDKMVAGGMAILSLNKTNRKVSVSFHRDCHPLWATTVVLIVLSIVSASESEFTECFIADTRGLLIFENETGFNLARIQYLRDLVGSHLPKSFSS